MTNYGTRGTPYTPEENMGLYIKSLEDRYKALDIYTSTLKRSNEYLKRELQATQNLIDKRDDEIQELKFNIKLNVIVLNIGWLLIVLGVIYGR